MFISRIKEIRIQKRISQKELAKRINFSQVQVSRIERNLSNTSLLTIEKIAKALGSDVCIREIYYYNCSEFEYCTKPSKSFLNCGKMGNLKI